MLHDVHHEDTPGREGPHDVVGLRPQKGTMWMSKDRVPSMNIESPYGGGVSSLPGATGSLLLVKFPAAPVLLAGGPQLGSWQVAVVQVDETPTRDASGWEYPRAEQNRQWPTDTSESHNGPGHTVVAGGPVGPCETPSPSSEESQDPLEHAVLIHADPAGQPAAVGTLSPSDCYPAGRAGPCVAGGHVGPDDYLQVLEPLELLVLDHADPAGQHAVIRDTVKSLEHPLTLPDMTLDERLVEKISDWEPAASPVPDTTLDGRLMEGNYLPGAFGSGVSLDSGLMAGMSSLEPLEQSVLNSLLVARPGKGITEERSDWEPVAHPVPDISLDGRPMEGTTYLEHSALGVSLDSGLMAGMSSLEPLRQSVLNTLLVARPEEGTTKEITDGEPVAHPVPNTTLDGRLMEGNTYLGHSALGVSLDSGLMAGMSRPEPLEQSVFGTLLVARPVEALTETDTEERPALASQVNYEDSKLKLSARPMLDADLDTDLSEHAAPMTDLDLGNDDLGRRPMEGITDPRLVELSGLALVPDSRHEKYSPSPRSVEQGVLDVNRRYDILDSCYEPQFGSDSGQSSLEWEDAIRHAVLKSRSVGWVPARDEYGLMLSPVEACCGDKEMSLDEVCSEGLWQWNMDMDV